MARTATKTAQSAPKKPTAAELREWYEKNKKQLSNFAKADNAITQLRDVTKTSNKTITAFNKETLRTYLQNIGSNEKNLRNLSRYLFYRCHAYYRLIMYNATMFDLSARTVVPQYDLLNPPDKDSFLKDYQETLDVLERLNLQYEMLKVYVNCFIEDVFYGCVYYDETGMFILPLPADYCKIVGIYSTSDFSFAMDMSYFRNRQTLLEYYGEPFTQMYNAYQNDTQNGKWQIMPDEYCVCMKARAEDWETVLPVFSGLLNSIISLIDLEDIQAIADEQEIYKMIWLQLETITNSDEADDWKVDPNLVIQYFNRMIDEALPEYTTAAIVPGKLDQISFNNDKATDTNKVAKATESLFNSSGGCQVLNSASISGTTAFEAAIKADTELAISMLLPQTQSWLNRMMTYWVSNPAKITFFEVSSYTKAALKKDLLESCQYGFSNILAYNSLNGISEKSTIALNFLENDCLNLTGVFKPLQSSYTQSTDTSNSGGAPTKDSTELTDDGESSREKRDKA